MKQEIIFINERPSNITIILSPGKQEKIIPPGAQVELLVNGEVEGDFFVLEYSEDAVTLNFIKGVTASFKS